MKQSERMRLSKAYHEHPLRKQYESEKNNLSITSPMLYIYYFIIAIPIILFFVYGYLFFADGNDYIDVDALFGTGAIFVVVFLGIVNVLFIGPFVFLWAVGQIDKLKEKAIPCKDLKEKYAKLGLIEVSDPFRESCGEYDDDGDLICSVTGELLDYREFAWCEVKGNCKHCSKFVTAYLGEDALEYWNYEIQK